ncbi:MAG: sulfite exporter TauE/SafE family protein [Planctomycetes bacterium]|nr:sulfite exporter TauE/SafE family protein [Planctomycetota bacterium]
MFVLIATTLAASLLGSLHCVGMCGAFVAIAATPAHIVEVSRARLLASYHLGRLVVYVVLGAMAGLLGQTLNQGGMLVGIQHAAAILAGAVMIIFGLATLARIGGLSVPRAPLPGFLTRLVRSAYGVVFEWHPAARAATLGLLTTLLPCGWLYTFATTAAGTGSAPLGAVTMAAFWLGTLPALTVIGAGAQRLAGPMRQGLPLATAMAMVVVGMLAIAGKITSPAACHEAANPLLAREVICNDR